MCFKIWKYQKLNSWSLKSLNEKCDQLIWYCKWDWWQFKLTESVCFIKFVLEIYSSKEDWGLPVNSLISFQVFMYFCLLLFIIVKRKWLECDNFKKLKKFGWCAFFSLEWDNYWFGNWTKMFNTFFTKFIRK